MDTYEDILNGLSVSLREIIKNMLTPVPGEVWRKFA